MKQYICDTAGECGYAFHTHHYALVEWCWDYKERTNYIEQWKPLGEQELRLRLFRLIPANHIPLALLEAGNVYQKAVVIYRREELAYQLARVAFYHKTGGSRSRVVAAYPRARVSYDEAKDTYNEAVDSFREAVDSFREAGNAFDWGALHNELCPDCPWDGESIFADRGRRKE